jgi:outer membrane receptor protein involved in Fe transport
MRRMKLLFVFLLVFAALNTGYVDAASVRGTLRTDQGAPLPLVVVIAEDQRTGHRLTTVTGSAGRYRFEDLEAGEYEFSAEIPGARLSPERHVVLNGNETTSLDWTLAPSPVSERVVVTATRSESATSTLGVSVSMIDRAWLEARRPATLTQALESVPGVSTSRSGGVGALSSLFLRGGESRFTRVMVDGVAVNEPGGYVNFATSLPLEIERVEVVRGAVSSLYGTDALAGAVQILTHRAGSDEKLAFRAEIEGGRSDTRRVSGGTTGRHGVFDWNAGLQRFSTENSSRRRWPSSLARVWPTTR